MTAIKAEIFADAEAWLRENVPDMEVDSVAAVRRKSKFHPDGGTLYHDVEEDYNKSCTMADHVRALTQLCDMVGRTLFVGGIKSPHDLTDAGNWDVEVVDAFYQLVLHGEVIYG